MVLEAGDRLFSEAEATALLERSGCRDIRPLVEEEEEEGGLL